WDVIKNGNSIKPVAQTTTVDAEETPPKAMVSIDEVGFDWSYMVEDEVPTNMALMVFSDSKALLSKSQVLMVPEDSLSTYFFTAPMRVMRHTRSMTALGRDIKKLKENVHAIQVRCENCGEAHLNKECLLHEEVRSVKEVKYGEFGRPFLNNNENNARYCVGPPGFYTRVDNRSPFGEKRPRLNKLMNKHIKESTRKRAKMEEWMKKLKDNMELNTRNQNASLKILETQIGQLVKDYKARATNEVQDPLVGQCKAIFANNKTSTNEASSKGTSKLQGVSFISDDNVQVPRKHRKGHKDFFHANYHRNN
nr:hypothetical protein [Tanacetum cinerariifolium]